MNVVERVLLRGEDLIWLRKVKGFVIENIGYTPETRLPRKNERKSLLGR